MKYIILRNIKEIFCIIWEMALHLTICLYATYVCTYICLERSEKLIIYFCKYKENDVEWIRKYHLYNNHKSKRIKNKKRILYV